MKTGTFDNGWVAFAIWVAATFAVAILGSSLTWDGSYYLWRTLEQGFPMVAHFRYANYLLLEPALLASQLGGSMRVAAAVHGVMCGMTGILCFLGILLLTKQHPRERVWLLAGVVLSPLPGMIDATMEITPSMQATFLAVAAAWFLPTRLGLIVSGLAAIWMSMLHPIASPLLGFAACAVVLGDRQRWPAAALLMGIAVARALLVLLAATAYERGQFDWNIISVEFRHMRASTPWWLVVEGALLLAIVSTGKISRRLEWIIWLALAGYTTWWMSEPMRWGGALNFRKFAAVFVVPFLFPAALVRLSKRDHPSGSILGLTTAACAAWVTAAVSWHLLLGKFERQVSQLPGPLIYAADGVTCVKDNSLSQWGATPLSMLMFGNNADRVFIGDGVTVKDGKVYLFETEEVKTLPKKGMTHAENASRGES